MADQTNRGLARALLDHINTLPVYTNITCSPELLKLIQKQRPKVTEASIVSALSYLKSQGMLAGGELRGVYRRLNGKTAPVDMETVVIDNLLDAMAKAEPVLKRCKKLLAALDAIK